jgi:hypothetical protein
MVIVLDSLATLLYWRWFAAHEVAPVRTASPTRATD